MAMSVLPLTERRLLRATLAAALIVFSSVLLAVADARPADAACGTDWQSESEPPETVLVLRTATGTVEEVGLKRYVAVVMASGEWPTSLPEALLEAGALATKQYAWYYALEGNHRDGYHNAAGHCYDVRDDSTDQVFRPETAEPTEKQKAARDALWGLSLRKNDKFFLTGYRQGSATKCADDADEWHLFATSAEDCADPLGQDSLEILHTYYSPKLTEVWAPGTDPEAADEPEASDEPEGADEAQGEDEVPASEEPSADGRTGLISSVFDRDPDA